MVNTPDKIIDVRTVDSNEPIVIPKSRKNLREAVEEVFHELGGVQGMKDWVMLSTVNKRIFYKDILPKLIPRELKGEFTGADGGPMKMVVEWAGSDSSITPAMKQVSDAIAASIQEDDD